MLASVGAAWLRKLPPCLVLGRRKDPLRPAVADFDMAKLCSAHPIPSSPLISHRGGAKGRYAAAVQPLAPSGLARAPPWMARCRHSRGTARAGQGGDGARRKDGTAAAPGPDRRAALRRIGYGVATVEKGQRDGNFLGKTKNT
ncbi:hypothetical protein ACP70R_039963 [Stipagrostis hirtigluma subsp. patula]